MDLEGQRPLGGDQGELYAPPPLVPSDPAPVPPVAESLAVWPQTYESFPVEDPPKKSTWLRNPSGFVVFLVVGLVGIITYTVGTITSPWISNMDGSVVVEPVEGTDWWFVELGEDVIPSIQEVVNEDYRASSYDELTDNYLIVHYTVSVTGEDLETYIRFLVDNEGFRIALYSDFTRSPGRAYLWKPSAETDKALTIGIWYGVDASGKVNCGITYFLDPKPEPDEQPLFFHYKRPPGWEISVGTFEWLVFEKDESEIVLVNDRAFDLWDGSPQTWEEWTDHSRVALDSHGVYSEITENERITVGVHEGIEYHYTVAETGYEGRVFAVPNSHDVLSVRCTIPKDRDKEMRDCTDLIESIEFT
ncbi:MAG: hypothetical protein LBG99_07165 [Propionibacteriaceae bacterium]|jgi:hypothetical protein|nr:hypothetical protein [Propionibacteriaceae bacterium]